MPIRLRRATPVDQAGVAALLDRYYTDWNVIQRDNEHKLIADLAHPTLGFLVAEQDARLIARVLLRNLPSIPDAVECKRLFVLDEFRGHGLARQLMDAAESQALAAGKQSMYLDTTEDFAAAILLYKRRGYEPCPRYNDNPQATLFFRKPLHTYAA
jgi:GNAT superfamily N-acetyltransferase